MSLLKLIGQVGLQSYKARKDDPLDVQATIEASEQVTKGKAQQSQNSLCKLGKLRLVREAIKLVP